MTIGVCDPGTGRLEPGCLAPDQMLAFILLGSLDSVLLTLQDWPFTLRDDQKLTLQSRLSGQFAVYAALLAIDTGMRKTRQLRYTIASGYLRDSAACHENALKWWSAT